MDALLAEGVPEHARPSLLRAVKVASFWLALWLVPVIVIAWHSARTASSPRSASSSPKWQSSLSAAPTRCWPMSLQLAVQHYHWLTASEMLDGLGMAETTPGPLIMVLQFVGFLAAFRDPGALNPYMAGVLASVLTVWVTFVPSLLVDFYRRALCGAAARQSRWLSAALSAITAAVVGVILNLAVWFAIYLFFGTVGEARTYGIRLYVPELSPPSISRACFSQSPRSSRCCVSRSA